jgi:hypothetical protein
MATDTQKRSVLAVDRRPHARAVLDICTKPIVRSAMEKPINHTRYRAAIVLKDAVATAAATLTGRQHAKVVAADMTAASGAIFSACFIESRGLRFDVRRGTLRRGNAAKSPLPIVGR